MDIDFGIFFVHNSPLPKHHTYECQIPYLRPSNTILTSAKYHTYEKTVETHWKQQGKQDSEKNNTATQPMRNGI